MLAGREALTLMSVNAVGDLFATDVVHKTHALPLVDRAEKFRADFDSDEELSLDAPKSGTSQFPEKLLPSDFYSMFWLTERQTSSSQSCEMKKSSKDWTRSWEKSFLEPIFRQWSKISFASFVQKRAALPIAGAAENETDEIIPVVKKPEPKQKKKRERKKEKKPVRQRKRKSDGSKDPVEPPIPALPAVPPIDETNLGLTGSKVWKIMSGSTDIFTSEIEVSDEESLDYLTPPSQVERRKMKRSQSSESSLPERPIADPAETMREFAAGLVNVSFYLKHPVTL